MAESDTGLMTFASEEGDAPTTASAPAVSSTATPTPPDPTAAPIQPEPVAAAPAPTETAQPEPQDPWQREKAGLLREITERRQSEKQWKDAATTLANRIQANPEMMAMLQGRPAPTQTAPPPPQAPAAIAPQHELEAI